MIARLLISRSSDERLKEIKKALVLHIGSVTFTHPDILYFKTGEKLGILEARKIKEHFSLKPYSAKARMAVLEDASALTAEAQNALLKILEELPNEAIIILGADSDSKLLPTVLSRCQVTHLHNPTSHRTPTSEVGYEKDIEKLLSATVEERFEYIEKLKDREAFLKFILQYFHQELRLHPRGANVGFLQELLQAEKWTSQNVNIRAILEYLMLVMPQKL